MFQYKIMLKMPTLQFNITATRKQKEV